MWIFERWFDFSRLRIALLHKAHNYVFKIELNLRAPDLFAIYTYLRYSHLVFVQIDSMHKDQTTMKKEVEVHLI